MLSCPVVRLAQPRRAVQTTGVMSKPLPLLGGARQLALEPNALAILGEPFAEPRPLADQRLVRDLNRVLRKRDQAGVRQRVQHGPHLRLAVGPTDQLADGYPPARVLGPVAKLGQ